MNLFHKFTRFGSNSVNGTCLGEAAQFKSSVLRGIWDDSECFRGYKSWFNTNSFLRKFDKHKDINSVFLTLD
jgi:hypothetical protein